MNLNENNRRIPRGTLLVILLIGAVTLLLAPASAGPSLSVVPGTILVNGTVDISIVAETFQALPDNGSEISVYDPIGAPSINSALGCPLPSPNAGGRKWTFKAGNGTPNGWILNINYSLPLSGSQLDILKFGENIPNNETINLFNGATVTPPNGSVFSYRWVDQNGGIGTDLLNIPGFYVVASCGVNFGGTNTYQASQTLVVINPSINLTKTPNQTKVLNGSAVNYTYTVTNTGDVNLTGVDITDHTFGSLITANQTLIVGQSKTFFGTAVLTTNTTNIATTNGTPVLPGGQALALFQVNATAQAFVRVIHPNISLSKTVNTSKIVNGSAVTYTYNASNTGDVPLTVNISDDHLGVILAPTVIAAGANTGNITRTTTLTTNTTNTATATGVVQIGPNVTATASAIVTVIGACVLGYPDSSHLPQSNLVFTESEVLRAFAPKTAGSGDTIKVWYNDEHALTLGVRKVIVKTTTGTTTTNYTIEVENTDPDNATNPVVGTTNLTGDQAGTDVSNRPMWPALFITDITTNLSNRSGDWQQGGTAGLSPNDIFGTWKGAVRNVDKTKTPNVVTVTPDVDPAKNNWNLGSGSDAPPLGFNNLTNQGYGAEVRWNVNDLGLLSGHIYRLQFMVHDGDQNKVGGDSGEACVNVVTK